MPEDFKKYYEEIKKTGRLPMPKIIAIEPTYRCNLSCSICFYKNEKKHYPQKELKAENFINFLNKVVDYNTLVEFPGWEPLMKKGFLRIIGFLSRKNILSLVLTNGTLINENNYLNFLYNKNNIIMLSIDGDKYLHNKIRGNSLAYDRVVKAIKLLKNKCRLDIVCVISEKNLASLWKVPRIVRGLGLNKVIFEYERKYSQKDITDSLNILGEKEGFSDLKVSNKNMPNYSLIELKENIERMEKEAKKQKVEVGYLPAYFKKEMSTIYHRKVREKYKCTCRYLDRIRIDPQGNYIHCFAFRKAFGNILGRQSLKEVWQSGQYREFRKKLLKNNLMPICETCWGATPLDMDK